MRKLTIIILFTIFITGIASAAAIKEQQIDDNSPGRNEQQEINNKNRNEQRQNCNLQNKHEHRQREFSPENRNENRGHINHQNKQKVNQQKNNEQRKDFNTQNKPEQRKEHTSKNKPEQHREHAPHNRPEREHGPQNRSEMQREVKPVTVNGVLKLERGFVAVQSDSADVYFVPLLNRYIGFITGLTEGTSVTIEGFQFRNFVHPQKLTIGDRTIDFPRHMPMIHRDKQNKPNLNR